MKKSQRGAFTLIEIIIAITILSIMMLYLYRSYAALNLSNAFYQEEATAIKESKLKQKIIFLDFSLLLFGEYKIVQNEKKEDAVFLQTSNSMHGRINPYIAYIIKDARLYRVESYKKITADNLGAERVVDIDDFGKVEKFRVYENSLGKKEKLSFLIDVAFKNSSNLLMRVRALNEY
ncbi:prepilin-type N-terminal cleavage/methylation domain-containing protein [Sulfurimonas sp.]|uniref:prepilin-type N-terminal cleavage/methylation domain-containing protein n=1 Tax=Sulfurimonas sp. TaxID=2022749 RepID=UPI001A04E573|nr:prepilin-type N-terminal cleavage/methylation domain-containing protein [Sulfurimonas sp.]MBE0513716.1 prepilin-type N-terminal cleavage/methylation domain-containing protein [Sulfurimonas sp.]